jgi:hypothetical protein
MSATSPTSTTSRSVEHLPARKRPRGDRRRDELGIELPDTEWDTVGGLVQLLGARGGMRPPGLDEARTIRAHPTRQALSDGGSGQLRDPRGQPNVGKSTPTSCRLKVATSPTAADEYISAACVRHPTTRRVRRHSRHPQAADAARRATSERGRGAGEVDVVCLVVEAGAPLVRATSSLPASCIRSTPKPVVNKIDRPGNLHRQHLATAARSRRLRRVLLSAHRRRIAAPG